MPDSTPRAAAHNPHTAQRRTVEMSICVVSGTSTLRLCTIDRELWPLPLMSRRWPWWPRHARRDPPPAAFARSTCLRRRRNKIHSAPSAPSRTAPATALHAVNTSGRAPPPAAAPLRSGSGYGSEIGGHRGTLGAAGGGGGGGNARTASSKSGHSGGGGGRGPRACTPVLGRQHELLWSNL